MMTLAALADREIEIVVRTTKDYRRTATVTRMPLWLTVGEENRNVSILRDVAFEWRQNVMTPELDALNETYEDFRRC